MTQKETVPVDPGDVAFLLEEIFIQKCIDCAMLTALVYSACKLQLIIHDAIL